MEKTLLPEHGALTQFRRLDEDFWHEGEYDAENDLFIEIYSLEPVTHNSSDIAEWKPLEIGSE